MYDFANSGYTTVVLTAVFNAYFVGVVAQGAPWGTLAWTLTLAVSYAIAMVAAPLAGAWADARAAKKRLLGFFTAGCVAATAMLALVGRGDLALAVFAIVASNVFYSLGDTMIAAFLPELARPDSIGRVSGWGWSFGYLGGMTSLGLSLAWVLAAQAQGQTADQFVPVAMLITAGVYGAAALVTFAWLRERSVAAGPGPGPDTDTGTGTGPGPGPGTGTGSGSGSGTGSSSSWTRLRATLGDARRFRDFGWLLACGACYQAGIAVVITLAAVYAQEVMGFDTPQTMALIFVVNVASAAGAFGFGYSQDRLGSRGGLAATLVGWIVTVAVAASATTATAFWAAATLAGLCMGSSQSCGRALVGLFAPPGRLGEFYGLWGLATRLASIVGPVTYGVVTWATDGNHRLAILCTGVFFLASLAMVGPIDMQRGRRAALQA